MKLLGNFKKAALVAMMCATATGAIAATQGSLGTNSTGTFDITLNHKGNAKVWGLVDVNLTDTHATESVSICTFNNNTNRSFFYYNQQEYGFYVNRRRRQTPIPYTIKLHDKGGTNGETWGEGGLPSGQQGSAKYKLRQGQLLPCSDLLACRAGSNCTTQLT
ncbi:MAG: hypothetical protein QS721_01635 [Candidatus Endonucleobacter sp. (ex Gigantidas childressi)]|nr:hypothetical protein [Candidatus Endonucleobacter sp. (ex Gigantidas childressi)]